MYEKMSKAINLYWFYNDASERNNSLNGHSNEPRIKWIEVGHASCQIKSPYSLDESSNTLILNTTINHITSTKGFDNSIFTF